MSITDINEKKYIKELLTKIILLRRKTCEIHSNEIDSREKQEIFKNHEHIIKYFEGMLEILNKNLE